MVALTKCLLHVLADSEPDVIILVSVKWTSCSVVPVQVVLLFVSWLCACAFGNEDLMLVV